MNGTPETSVIRTHYKTAVIGAGPAGLAAAAELVRAGVTDIILIEREALTGGILNQCIHNGFGLGYYNEDLTGPEFAARLKAELKSEIVKLPSDKKKPVIICSSMVSNISLDNSGILKLQIHSRAHGMLILTADTVITTTGCRERTRENIDVPGTRPAGIFTAGQAQNLINLRHYKTGCSAVIQGSGDIGLIMARRLTLEGIEVKAVFERLPYLSGSIRNKVQCLDHFGIPLHLGRQINRIHGSNRVSAVSTTALTPDFSPVKGSEIEFECDTVLIAAGLIPELEAVKPAGVSLPDRFHPAVNLWYETNAEGIFVAGNCLHINDLADSAAGEGFKAAAAAAAYLSDKQAFRLRAETGADQKPYKDPVPDKELNAEYFEKLEKENLLVCIVCPKGCLLSEGNYGCRRGLEYYNRTGPDAEGFSQRIHTTVESPAGIVPVVSVEEVPVKIAIRVVEAVKEAGTGIKSNDDFIMINVDGTSLRFNICRPAC